MALLGKAGAAAVAAVFAAASLASLAVGAPRPAAHLPAPAAATPPPAANGARLAPGAPLPASELEAFVDGVVTEAMARDHIAGAAVSVVQNGQLILKKGYGVDRLSPARPVDPDRTLFRIGSISKTFTWIALMREVDAGRVRLDAPINLYLPQKDQVPDQGMKQPVRVRDLMTHTPGFEDRALGQLMERNPARIRPLEVYLKQERPRRVREPGGVPSYSNYGAALAGEAVTQVTGRTFQALAEAEVINPLGMTRTTFREPYPARAGLPAPMDPRLAGDVSRGFSWIGDTFRPEPFEFVTQAAPAGAGSSTVADMARYMTMILNGGSLDGAQVYGPSVAQAFRTTLLRAAPGVNGWDHGFMEMSLPGGFRGYGHDGATMAFHSRMVTVPQLGLGVFVVDNTSTGRPLAEALPVRIVGRFYAPPPPTPPAPSAWLKENAKAFAGSYLTTRRAYGGLEKFADLLHAEARASVGPTGELVTDNGQRSQRWTPDASASLDQRYVTFHEAGGHQTLVFEIKDGRAVRWFDPSGASSYERAPLWAHPWLIVILAIASTLAALATLAGQFTRGRRDFRQTTVQQRASAAQTAAAILWLAAMVCMAMWLMGASDAVQTFYGWPGAWVLIASSCCFVASVMTVISLALLPVVWRGGRRLDSWTSLRKLRFTATSVWFGLFAIVLGLWGALQPWVR
jgi:CubicO group peptidase (beta-lactamase class C family)